MSEHTALADRYIAVWNETDPKRRLELITQTYTEDASYLDPLMHSKDHQGIDAMIQGAQAKYPGHRFQRITSVDAHHDQVRFSWAMVGENGPTLAKGTDICTVVEGRFQSVLGFLDEVRGEAVLKAVEVG